MKKSFMKVLFAGTIASFAYAQTTQGQTQTQAQDPVSEEQANEGDNNLPAFGERGGTREPFGGGRGESITQSRGGPRAQARGGAGTQARGGGSRPGSAGSSTLERTGLKIGQKVPDITIHDDKGRPFSMANLKGKYTVITFGCLT